MILGPRVMNFPKKTYVTVEDLNAAMEAEETARNTGDSDTLLSAKTFTTETLQEELPRYTKPTHLVDLTFGQDSSGNPIFVNASETAETIDGWLTAGDNVVYRIQYGQTNYVYGTTTDRAVDNVIIFAAFITTSLFGPLGVYRLEARWEKTEGTWDALPTIYSIIPMETDYNPAAIAQPFSTTSTYAVGAAVMYDGVRWRCTTAVSTAGAWNPSNWTQEDVQTAIENSSSITIRVYDED